MKANEDKHVEELIHKMMKSQTLDKPAFDFTSKVMQQLEVKTQNPVFVYKPLISKQAGFTISVLALILLVFSVNQKNTISNSWKIPVDFSAWFRFNMNLSDTTNYCLLIGSLMVITQVFYLKNYFQDKY